MTPLPKGERVRVRGLPRGGEGERLSQTIPLRLGGRALNQMTPLPKGERASVKGLPQGGEGERLSQMIPLPLGETSLEEKATGQ